MEEVQARIPAHDRRREDRVAAAVDVSQPTGRLDRSADLQQPAIGASDDGEATSAVDPCGRGNHRMAPGRQGIGAVGEDERSRSRTMRNTVPQPSCSQPSPSHGIALTSCSSRKREPSCTDAITTSSRAFPISPSTQPMAGTIDPVSPEPRCAESTVTILPSSRPGAGAVGRRRPGARLMPMADRIDAYSLRAANEADASDVAESSTRRTGTTSSGSGWCPGP